VISSETTREAERSAGIVTRALAAVIDLLVVLVIMSGLYGGLVLVRLVYSPSAFTLPSLNAVFSTVVTFVVAVGYLTACWTVSGSTAGAVAMGLRVVGRRSQRVSLPVGLLRAIGCVLFRSDCCGWWSIDDESRCRTLCFARTWCTRGHWPGDFEALEPQDHHDECDETQTGDQAGHQPGNRERHGAALCL
jgi:uncharacterized RDD family membrane protein YckC